MMLFRCLPMVSDCFPMIGSLLIVVSDYLVGMKRFGMFARYAGIKYNIEM